MSLDQKVGSPMSERTTSEGTQAQALPEETKAPEGPKRGPRLPSSGLTITVGGVAVAIIAFGIYFATSGSPGRQTASGHTPASAQSNTSSASAGRSTAGPMPGAPRTPQASGPASASTPGRTQPGPI